MKNQGPGQYHSTLSSVAPFANQSMGAGVLAGDLGMQAAKGAGGLQNSLAPPPPKAEIPHRCEVIDELMVQVHTSTRELRQRLTPVLARHPESESKPSAEPAACELADWFEGRILDLRYLLLLLDDIHGSLEL
jgi:hypothetical protein